MAEETTQSATQTLDNLGGAFVNSLRRNNKQIRDDRALSIAEDAEMIYKREIEDLQTKIKRLERDRENMLDLSPDNTFSIKLASEFDAKAFVAKDLEVGVQLRELRIKLDIMKERYSYLFES